MTETFDTARLGLVLKPGEDPHMFGAKCKCHHTHQPEPRYLEEHHIIPRAWQRHWTPKKFTAPAHEPNGEGLWFTETIALCRTGHGNVHYWIERMVKAYPTVPKGSDHTYRAVTAAREGQLVIGREESTYAEQALTLWSDHGGSVEDLFTAGLYGGIYGGNTEG